MQNFQIIFLLTRTYSENFKSAIMYLNKITFFSKMSYQHIFQYQVNFRPLLEIRRYIPFARSLAGIGKAEMYATTGPCKEIEMSHLQKVI